MGVNPNAFGPGVWNTMMMFAWQYSNDPTKEEQTNMLQWIRLTMMHIPCPKCSSHAKAYVEKHQPDVTNKERLINYIVEFHNFVNISLKKQRFTVQDAKAAFLMKLAEDYKEMPQAMKLIKDNTERMKFLEDQVVKYEKTNSIATMNSSEIDYYYYATIGLSIALGLLLIIFLIVLIVNHKRQKRLKNELFIAKNKYSMST